MGAILAIPVLTLQGTLAMAWGLVGFVRLEVIMLAANRMRCPLTDVAGRYTPERQDSFDIYLPLWLPCHNVRKAGDRYVIERMVMKTGLP